MMAPAPGGNLRTSSLRARARILGHRRRSSGIYLAFHCRRRCRPSDDGGGGGGSGKSAPAGPQAQRRCSGPASPRRKRVGFAKPEKTPFLRLWETCDERSDSALCPHVDLLPIGSVLCFFFFFPLSSFFVVGKARAALGEDREAAVLRAALPRGSVGVGVRGAYCLARVHAERASE